LSIFVCRRFFVLPSDEIQEEDSSDSEAGSIADKPSPKVSHYV